MKFCIGVNINDVMMCAKFGGDRLMGLGVARVKFQAFPLTCVVDLYNTAALPWTCVITQLQRATSPTAESRRTAGVGRLRNHLNILA